MTNRPTICVIIPVYNGERFLAEALQSVLNQTLPSDEIIVVDDGSTDETATVAAMFGSRLHYIKQVHRGVASARNCGLGAAKTEFIAFLDADDLWPEDKLERQVVVLRANPDLALVLGRVQYFGLFTADEERIKFEGPEHTTVGVNLGSGVFRRSAFEQAGGFDETLDRYEDHDWFLRARENQLPMAILPDITLHRRLHEDNMTRTQPTRNSMLQVLKRALDRRRAIAGSAMTMAPFLDYDLARRNTP